jgi:hypothetical protein
LQGNGKEAGVDNAREAGTVAFGTGMAARVIERIRAAVIWPIRHGSRGLVMVARVLYGYIGASTQK